MAEEEEEGESGGQEVDCRWHGGGAIFEIREMMSVLVWWAKEGRVRSEGYKW